jgi:hypothetical protein
METGRDISGTAWILGKVETEADWAQDTLFKYIFRITFLARSSACGSVDVKLLLSSEFFPQNFTLKRMQGTNPREKLS